MTDKILSALRDPRVWLLFFSLQIPSLRALFKYAPDSFEFLIAIYLIVTWLFYADLLHDGLFRQIIDRYLTKIWTIVALIILITAINFVMYPIADSLERQGRGSDQDDALIITGERLWSGNNPYQGENWPHLSAAAGPGWVLLASPLAGNGLYVLLNPLLIAITVYVIARNRRIQSALIFLLLMMSSLAFWELTVIGSDMISIGCLFALATTAVYCGWQSGWIGKILSATFLGFVGTARAIFFFLVPLLSAFLFKKNKPNAIVLFIISAITLAGLHLIFYLWNPEWYLPLHVFGKGQILLGSALWIVANLGCLLAAVLSVYKVKDSVESWIFNCWFTVAVVVGFAGLGDLLSCGFIFANWEGANYVAVQMPLIAVWSAINLNKIS